MAFFTTTKMKTGRKKLSYEKKKSLYGYGFIMLWIIGFLLFFLRPFVSVILFSLSKIEYLESGYNLTFVGLSQYRRAFLEDPDIVRQMSSSLVGMLYNVPVIVIISLAIAVILNQKFFGRTLARAVFFIPVIVAGGIVISILKGDIISSTMLAGQKSSAMLQVSGLRAIMLEMGLPLQVINLITTVSNNIFDLLWKCGIQILLFLASLQTISPSLFEASSIEGATGWDNFWKITIPMVSPMMLIAIVYSIIDSFTDYSNVFMRTITRLATEINIEYSSALAISYSLAILLFIGIVYKIVNRFVFYSVD